ncbi:MAG: hypothetical protein ACRDZ4_06970 [Egibacteraceae bacterium]
MDEIKRDLTESRGGRKWHLRVMDEDDRIIAAETITVPGEPKLEPGLEDLGGGDMDPSGGETETLEEQIENDPDIVRAKKDERLMEIETRKLARQAELDRAKAEAATARRALDAAQRGEQPGPGTNGHKTEEDKLAALLDKQLAPMREQNATLQRALDEEKRRNADRESEERRRREMADMLSPLKEMQAAQQRNIDAILQKLSQPAPAPTGPSSELLLQKLESMKTELKSDFTQQIQTVLGGVKDSVQGKIDVVTQALNALTTNRNDPATNALIALATKSGPGGAAPGDPFQSLIRAMEAMKTIQTMTGTMPGSSGPQDFPSYLVDRIAGLAPDVLTFMRETQQQAGVVTQEMLEKKMREAGAKMYSGLDQTIKQEIGKLRVAAQQQVGLPAAAPAPTAAPGTQSVGPAPPPVQAPGAPAPAPGIVQAPGIVPAPGVAPAPGAAAPPSATPAPGMVPAGPAYPMGMSAEDFAQTQKRVNYVLTMLRKEIGLGVQAMRWPESAFAHLPKAIIDAILPITTDEELANIIKPFGEPALLDQIFFFVSDANPQHEWYRRWLTDGVNWIKDAAAAQTGQAPEPSAEDEEEGPS